MSKRSGSIVTEKLHGKYREAGYDVDVIRAKTHKVGGAVVLLKGGLGDPTSESMTTLADELIDQSNGQLVVGRVSTIRPNHPVAAFFGSFRARKHRSQSMRGASDLINDRFHPRALVLAGQSEGGVSVVDGAVYQLDHPLKNKNSPKLGVVTIDAPGVYEALEYDGAFIEGLGRLGMNCMEDLGDLSWTKRAKMLGSFARNATPVEMLYFANEANYLKNVDMSNNITHLRDRGVDVMHIWHSGDVVPGAEMACEFSRVYPGGHMRFMVEPTPVATDIYQMADRLLDYSAAA